MIEVRELARCGRAGFVIELCRISRCAERVSDHSVSAHRPRSHAADVTDHVFRLSSGDGQPHEMITAAFLHREIDSAAVQRPLRCTLAIIDHITDFVAIAAVSIHNPHMSVFHGRLTVSEAAARAAIDDEFAIWRPQRIVFAGFCSG